MKFEDIRKDIVTALDEIKNDTPVLTAFANVADIIAKAKNTEVVA
jgi:hypothetical protein